MTLSTGNTLFKENCSEDPAEQCTGEKVSLLGKTFEKISQVHGHNAYKSNDEVYTLCFSLGDLVGGGQWIVKVGVLSN